MAKATPESHLTTTGPCFLGLARELRDIIYKQALPLEVILFLGKGMTVTSDATKATNAKACFALESLLQVNKQVHDEVFETFYKYTTVKCEVTTNTSAAHSTVPRSLQFNRIRKLEIAGMIIHRLSINETNRVIATTLEAAVSTSDHQGSKISVSRRSRSLPLTPGVAFQVVAVSILLRDFETCITNVLKRGRKQAIEELVEFFG